MQDKMARIIREIKLDLKQDELRGFQDFVHPEKIVDYVYLNVNGSVAPNVDVVKKNGVYYLSLGLSDDVRRHCNYGGHHRAVAHDISGHILHCNLMDEHGNPEKAQREEFFLIKDIRFDFDFHDVSYMRKLKVREFNGNVISRLLSYQKRCY